MKAQTCPLQDRDGDTALFTAAFSEMKSTVELLLKREADANATSIPSFAPKDLSSMPSAEVYG